MRAAAVLVAVTVTVTVISAGALAGCTFDEDTGEQCTSQAMDQCYCAEGAVCDLSCHDNLQCALDCMELANCEVSCEGAEIGCAVSCDFGSSCDIDAANAPVTVDCNGATTCVVERCLDDRCTVDCNDKVPQRTGDVVACVAAASALGDRSAERVASP